MKSKKILFFSPHSGIWPSALPEAAIAKSLSNCRFDISFIVCNQILSNRCIVFDSHNLIEKSIPQERKHRVCIQCNRNRDLLKQYLPIKFLYLDDFISTQDLKEIDQDIYASNIQSLLATKVSGINVGHIATYETLLTFKKSDYKFDDHAIEYYRGYLKGCLLALRGLTNIFEYQRPDILITYNALYSINRCISLFCESQSVKTYNLNGGNHASLRYQTLVLSKKTNLHHERHLLLLWDRFKYLPCSKEMAAIITDHFLTMIKGKTVFQYGEKISASVNIRNHYGLRENQKLLLATMSSADERFAAQSVGISYDYSDLLFETQIHWVEWLVKFAISRRDIFIVIRVHPREFPNQRENVLSEQAQKLKSIFKDLPSNVAINWPSEGLSIYDFMIETNVLLNHRSSAGKEFALLGIPVVVYAKKIHTFPTDFCFVGETEEEYIRAINNALEKQWSFQNISSVYRWLALDYIYSVLDISNIFKYKEARNKNLLERALNRLYSVWNPDWEKNRDCKHLSRLKTIDLLEQAIREDVYSVADIYPVTTVSLQEENLAIRKELKRLSDALKLYHRPNAHLSSCIKDFLKSKSIN